MFNCGYVVARNIQNKTAFVFDTMQQALDNAASNPTVWEISWLKDRHYWTRTYVVDAWIDRLDNGPESRVDLCRECMRSLCTCC